MAPENKLAVILLDGSDIPVEGIVPEEFFAYAYAPGAREIKDTTDIGVKKLLEGFDFVLLYRDHIDEEDVEMCLDSGAYVSIAPAPGRLEAVYKKLASIEGVKVYRKEEIPEDLHFKSGKFVLDLHAEAKQGFCIRGLQSREKQVPFREYCKTKMFLEGVQGYNPELADQRLSKGDTCNRESEWLMCTKFLPKF
ncbi:unnamed protein product [Allacma fusca]|uniref:Uncharacterized protein n=1 Tax=Allacma fusca TaxID=39272 RepID=A0A8J2JJF6_9HEXA|nr:unnamed protein product [Allacma fusca]